MGDDMNKLRMALALGGSAALVYGAFRLIEPLIEGPKLKFPDVKEMDGTYICKGTVDSEKIAPRKVEIQRRGLKRFNIKSRVKDQGFETYVKDMEFDGDSFSYSGDMQVTFYRNGEDKGSCFWNVTARGEYYGNKIEFSEHRTALATRDVCKAIMKDHSAKISCQKISESKCRQDYHRAVFIRPCNGDFYSDKSFEVVLGKKSVESVCQDLRENCISDIFIGMKVDHPAANCGIVGTPNPKPAIENIIKECNDMNIHAWVPVFYDPYLISTVGESIALQKNDGTRHSEFLDPENQLVIEKKMAEIRLIIDNYEVDGLNLDYIRYSEEEGYSPNPEAIENFVKKVKANSRGLIVSADVMANPGMRNKVGQQGVPRLVDVIMPMSYSWFHTISTGIDQKEIAELVEDSELRANIALLASENVGKPIIPILRGWNIDNRSIQEDISHEVIVVKGLGVEGYGIFTYEKLLIDGHEDSIGRFEFK